MARNDRGPKKRGRATIAIVTHSYAPMVGGAETHFVLAASSLSSRSAVCVLSSSLCLTPNRLLNITSTHPDPSLSREGAPEVIYLPSLYILNERFILPLTLLARLVVIKPLVVWTNHPSASGLAAGLYAKIAGSRWAATYHADISPRSVLRRAFTWLEGKWLMSADLVEVSSPTYAEKLARRGIRPGRTLILRPFTFGERLGDGPPQGSKDTQPSTQSSPFLFVGALDRAHSYKHPELLLAALARLRAGGTVVSAEFVGEGDTRAQLEREAARLGLSQAALFLGGVSDATLRDLYRRAWALVVPSSDESEGFSIVVIEALSHGCPVLAADTVPGVADFADGGGALTFRAGDVSDLAQKLFQLANQPGLRGRLVAQTVRLGIRRRNSASLDSIVDAISSLRPRTVE